MTSYLISGGTAYHHGSIQPTDILLEDGLITRLMTPGSYDRTGFTGNGIEIIDAKDRVVMPGFVDLHAHLRDPGQTHKEDIVTGTRAAAHGGFTTVCAMPNTEPVVDNIATVEYIRRKAHDLGFCKVLVIGAMSKKSEGKEIAEISRMLDGGIVGVSDDGRCVQNSKLMLNIMRYTALFNLPVIIHAEDYNLAGKGQIHSGSVSTRLGLSGLSGLAEEIIIARDIMLAEKAGCHLHIAHISTARSIELLRQAQKNGIHVTAEVTPHHLLLTQEACLDFNPNTKMKPPLRTEKDRQACIEALSDGTICCIATDHAPHADFEKDREFDYAPFGIIGFETAFPVLYEGLVEKGLITLETLIERMSVAPSRLLGLKSGRIEEGAPADLTIADLSGTTEVLPETILSKSKNTPWLGQTLQSRIELTVSDGRITWDGR